MKLKRTILAALFAALCCVATMVIQIPTLTQGYIHLGDTFVLMCGFLLGPLYGSLAAGIGSAMADLLTGYFIYIPATFLIKAIVALLAYLLNKRIKNILFCGLIAEIFMILGYYIYSVILTGNLIASLSGIPTNAIQGVVGALLCALLVKPIKNNKYYNKLWE